MVTGDSSLGQVWNLLIVILRFIVIKVLSKMIFSPDVKTNISPVSCRAKQTEPVYDDHRTR